MKTHKQVLELSRLEIPDVPTTSPRWDADWSPLKISFYAGDLDAPEYIKKEVAEFPERQRQESCILLQWREAVEILRRARWSWFEFHPQDHDWQVNGWKLTEDERIGKTVAAFPATGHTTSQILAAILSVGTELAAQQHWTDLPLNPTTADYCAEVMRQYVYDIDRMRYEKSFQRLQERGWTKKQSKASAQWAHDKIYLPLMSDVLQFIKPSTTTMGQMYRLDDRKLYRLAYELSYPTSVLKQVVN